MKLGCKRRWRAGKGVSWNDCNRTARAGEKQEHEDSGARRAEAGKVPAARPSVVKAQVHLASCKMLICVTSGLAEEIRGCPLSG